MKQPIPLEPGTYMLEELIKKQDEEDTIESKGQKE
jgi:hypothetical protein